MSTLMRSGRSLRHPFSVEVHSKRSSLMGWIGGAFCLAAIAGLLSLLPDIKRYLRMRNM